MKHFLLIKCRLISKDFKSLAQIKKQKVKVVKQTKIELIPYEDLEKHFTERKNKPVVKRVPRKFKKEWKHILYGKRYDYLELGQKLWHIQGLINPDYNRFLIKMVILNDNKRKQDEMDKY